MLFQHVNGKPYIVDQLIQEYSAQQKKCLKVVPNVSAHQCGVAGKHFRQD